MLAGVAALLLIAGLGLTYVFWPGEEQDSTPAAKSLPKNICALVGRPFLSSFMENPHFDHEMANNKGSCTTSSSNSANRITIRIQRFAAIGEDTAEQRSAGGFELLCGIFNAGRWEQVPTAPPAPAPNVGEKVCGSTGVLGELIVLNGDVVVQVELRWPEEDVSEVPTIAEDIARRTLKRLEDQ